MSSVEMVYLTTANSEFEAQLVAARLGAEGILWEIRGNRGVGSMYPVGPVDISVERTHLEMAQEMLLDAEIAENDLVDGNGLA